MTDRSNPPAYLAARWAEDEDAVHGPAGRRPLPIDLSITTAMREHAEFMTLAMARGYRPLPQGMLVCPACYCVVPATPEAVDGHGAWHGAH